MKRCLAAAFALISLLMLAPVSGAEVLPGLTSKVDYDNTDPDRYLIEIDLVNQIITVYDNSLGNKIVFQGLCTTGNRENRTSSGTFRVGDLKERFGYFVAFGQYAAYWTQVVRGIYIHSVMYDSEKLSSMSSSAYRNLGRAVSHGCIRVLPHHAQWIFYNCPPGTAVNIVRIRPKNPELIKILKSQIPSYSDYRQPADGKPYPVIVPAVINADKAPLRSGFSSRDKTLAVLKRGDKVKLLQIGSDWVKAETAKGKLGYIKTQYILCYPDEPVNFKKAYVAADKTYIYKSMSTSSKRLKTIGRGEEVVVIENPELEWYYGSFGGVSGYMSAKYVKLQTVMQYPAFNGTSDSLPENGFGFVESNLIGRKAFVKPSLIANLRDRPSTSGKRIGELPPGTPVTVLGKSGSWYKIEALGKTGFVNEICLIIE
ncbi:MAG: Bacterial SH3 domain protein [Firmicutes bacterium ADurb.Bin182]|nr:MAG: Bacterial SH3 domain protein [Firmicutes bacterium ADurb.Bin182]